MNANNEVWKLLEELSSKSGISEVIINNVDNVYIEREGELIRLNAKFSPEDIVSFCKEVAQFNKRQFNREHPILDGLLPDGSRINIISSVYTTSSPAITIRKYLTNLTSFDQSPGLFGLSPKWITFLKALVSSKQNIIISGGTGNGKTTFLNMLMQEVSPTERVVTIEDTKELQFKVPNTVRLITRNAASSIETPLGTRELLKNTLRMRPDRIIIGEVRGEEAFDLLQAMNTGHQGSMCTIHANSPAESLSRLENLFLFSGYDVPLKAVRAQMCSAIDFIIQLDKDKDGKRIVRKITEISNMESDNILLQDIAVNKDGQAAFTGLVPIRVKELMNYGLNTDFFIEI
ncbi:MAG: CpaF family protein [Bacteriovoracaceae bacterium]|nr:CpaF family protein [Bacteriovoracaceae bacterium]